MNKTRFLSLGRLVSVIVFALVLSACKDKVNQTNYDKIQSGMTTAEVSKILGEPTETSALNLGVVSGTSSVWKSDKSGTISVQFVNGKVQTKNFSK